MLQNATKAIRGNSDHGKKRKDGELTVINQAFRLFCAQAIMFQSRSLLLGSLRNKIISASVKSKIKTSAGWFVPDKAYIFEKQYLRFKIQQFDFCGSL